MALISSCYEHEQKPFFLPVPLEHGKGAGSLVKPIMYSDKSGLSGGVAHSRTISTQGQ